MTEPNTHADVSGMEAINSLPPPAMPRSGSQLIAALTTSVEDTSLGPRADAVCIQANQSLGR